MNSHTLFTKTPPLKLFLFAAVPGAISMLASALYQLIDGILVGQFLGETAFAALNLAMPLCHHQFFPGRSDRRRFLCAHLHPFGPQGG